MANFPINVINKSTIQKEQNSIDKAKTILFGLAFILIAVYIGASRLFAGSALVRIGILIALIALYITVLIFIYRFMIYREQEQRLDDKDSILKYYSIKTKFTTLEHIKIFYQDENQPMLLVRFRAGMFTEERQVETELLLTHMLDLINELKLDMNIFGIKEEFEDTLEYEYMLKIIDNIEDELTKKSILRVYAHSLEQTKKESNILELYLKVSVTSKLFEHDLVDFVDRLAILCNNHLEESTFRAIEIVDIKEVPNVMRKFLQLAVLDLSYAEVEQVIDDRAFVDMVTLSSIVTENNETYEVTQSNDLLSGNGLVRIK